MDGVITTATDYNGTEYGMSTHTFDSINLGSGVTVVIEGENALILKTRSSGDIIVGTDLNVNGGNALVTENPWGGWLSTFTGGKGKAGGYEGGRRLADGFEPGGGKQRVLNNDGSGGGYGSEGQQSDSATFGLTYGSEALIYLHGGSGGGGGGYLIFFKPAEEKPFHKLKLKDTARDMSLHPDGLQVATAHWDGYVRISRMEQKAAR